MDLNKIYQLLPESDQKKIRDIVLSYLNDCAAFLGCRIEDADTPKRIEVLPVRKTIPGSRFRFKFPVKLHGRMIPDHHRLGELYEDSIDGLWRGKYSWLKVRNLLREGHSIDDIFPEPPSAKAVDTLIKRKDNNGEHYSLNS